MNCVRNENEIAIVKHRLGILNSKRLILTKSVKLQTPKFVEKIKKQYDVLEKFVESIGYEVENKFPLLPY